MKAKSWVFTALTLLALGGPLTENGQAAEATHTGAKIYTPFPPYPYNARRYREQGFCMLAVVFGASGNVDDVSLKLSTGHPDLDDNALQYARAHWRGPANLRCVIPIDYRLHPYGTAPLSTRPGPDGWYTRLPSYPTLSLRFLERGAGEIEVTTNADGRVVQAEMTKSTGYARLDKVTTQYALAFWKGPPKSSKTIPVSYTMRMGSPGPN